MALLFPVLGARAEDDDMAVDVVVDLTEAGQAISRPSPSHPTYYYPVTKGYTPGGAPLADEKAPSVPTAHIEHLVALALAQQGYLLARKTAPPTLLLMFWWGYKAPDIMNNFERSVPFQPSNAMQARNPDLLVEQAAERGLLPTNILANKTEMYELTLGSKFFSDNDLMAHPGIRLESAIEAAREARYYLMVSALDFDAAIRHKKYIVYWTARISTELAGHTLDEVLPTLITRGAPMFGRDSHGPQISDGPIVPMGHVEMGTPVFKDYIGPQKAPANK
jgi:hypothetical protein